MSATKAPLANAAEHNGEAFASFAVVLYLLAMPVNVAAAGHTLRGQTEEKLMTSVSQNGKN